MGQARVVSPGFGTEKSRISHPNTGEMTATHHCYLLAGHFTAIGFALEIVSEIRLSKQDNDLDLYGFFQATGT